MFQTNRRDLLRCAGALGLYSLVARHPLAFGMAESGLSAGSAQALAAVAPREKLLLDFGWKFFQGHASDPSRDLGFGSGQGDFAKTGAFEFATEKFDDSRWRSLNLPHDWAVELPFVRDEALQSHGYKPLGRNYPETSVGWYRRGFDIPASDLGRRIVLEFDGAFRNSMVFVNGCYIGEHDEFIATCG
jgi:beta-galactosidase